ncbi:RNA polymerase II assembly factor like protein [Tanacetum coccineum]
MFLTNTSAENRQQQQSSSSSSYFRCRLTYRGLRLDLIIFSLAGLITKTELNEKVITCRSYLVASKSLGSSSQVSDIVLSSVMAEKSNDQIFVGAFPENYEPPSGFYFEVNDDSDIIQVNLMVAGPKVRVGDCNTPPENGSNVTLMASKQTQAEDFIHKNGSTKRPVKAAVSKHIAGLLLFILFSQAHETATEVLKLVSRNELDVSTIERTLSWLVELGVLSANGDESLSRANEISWEGVVSLLQLGKGLLSVKNISDIILSLISLAKGALSRAAQVWSSLINPVSEVEAERIFIQVKFYLNNADRIISHYPSQAFSIFKDITLCILTVLTFQIFLGNDEFLKSASDTLADLLEPTSVHLLNSLLDSDELGQANKFQIVDWLFMDMNISEPVRLDENSMNGIFSLKSGSMHGCHDVWRFVPADAKLSVVLELGVVANRRIMDDLQGLFVNDKTTFASNKLAQLVKDGLLLKGLSVKEVANVKTTTGLAQLVQKTMTIDSDAMEIDDTTQTNKKRKFPDGISEDVSLVTPRGMKQNALHELISLPRERSQRTKVNNRSTLPIYNGQCENSHVVNYKEAMSEYWIPWNRKPRSKEERDKTRVKQQWTEEEDQKLRKFVSESGHYTSWTKASEELKTKTPFECLSRYQRSLNSDIINRDWTSAEDNQLNEAVKQHGEKWQQIASLLPGRTGAQCSSRWRSALVPGRRTGRWEPDEDNRLIIAAKLFGNTCWKKLATCVPGRTQIQVRERRWNLLFPHEAKVLKETRDAQRHSAPSNFVDREHERPSFAKVDIGNHKQERRRPVKAAVSKHIAGLLLFILFSQAHETATEVLKLVRFCKCLV